MEKIKESQTLEVNESKDTQNDTFKLPETNTQTDHDLISSPVGLAVGKQKVANSEEEIPAANNDTKTACNDILSEEFTKEHPSPKSSPLLQQKEFENSKVSKDSYYEDANSKEAHAVCQLTLHYLNNGDLQGGGTGFVVRYDGQYAVFLTNNHVFNEKQLYSIEHHLLYATLQFKCSDSDTQTFNLNAADFENCFFFTCNLLDVTIIIFQKTVRQQLEAAVEFLDLNEFHITTIDDPATVIAVMQRPSQSTCTRIAAGVHGRQFGFDFYHQVSTDAGSSGSPAILLGEDDAHVIGIHKASLEIDYNLAVSMQAVLNALNALNHCIQCYYAEEKGFVLFNLNYEDCINELDISGKKLSLFQAEKSKWPIYHYDSMVSLLDKNVIKQTHVWFIPTALGWYWTPGDDFLPADNSINWMTLSQKTIVGGDFNECVLIDKIVLGIMENLSTIEYYTH